MRGPAATWAGLDRRDRLLFAVVGLGTVLAAVLPHVGGVTVYHRDVIHTGLVFVMLGLTWNIIAGYAGQISLGHAAFFGIGAYATAWLTTPGFLPGWIGGPLAAVRSLLVGLPLGPTVYPLLAVVVGAVVAAVVALLTGPAMFRLRGHYFAIGTLALAAIIQVILNNARAYSGGATGYYVNEGSSLVILGDVSIGPGVIMYYYTIAVTVLIVVAAYGLYHAKPGLGMRAIHGDEGAASSLGVDPFRYKMYAFVVSSFLVGLTGGLYAQYNLYLNPGSTLSVTWTIDALVVVILGGMGTVFGPIFGAVVFLVLDTGLSNLEAVGTLATTIEGVILILFVLFLPDGLYGHVQERWDRGRRLLPDWPG